MASLTKTSITYLDLQKNIDETTLDNALFDITGLETEEDRATDFIVSTFYKIQAISIKVTYDLSSFEDPTGAIEETLKQAFIYLTLGNILNSGGKKLGYGKTKQGMELLESLWGKGIYSEKEVAADENVFFEVTEAAYVPVGRMKDLYDNDLFN